MRFLPGRTHHFKRIADARGKPGGKWYKGQITRVNADGTYDLKYDDGDIDRRLRARSVRSLETKKKKSKT